MNRDTLLGILSERLEDPLMESRRLFILLTQAREALAADLRPIFAKFDLTDAQWRVLRILAVEADMDVSELARRSHLLGPSLSRILRNLDERGLITRRTDAIDSRRFLHGLSESGRALVDAVVPLFTPIYERITAEFGSKRLVQLNSLLIKLRDTLEADG